MSVFAKVLTRIFGKKSEKDMKILSPFVDKINSVFQPLTSLSDDELISDLFSDEEDARPGTLSSILV